MTSYFTAEERGKTVVLTLNRPPLNALTAELLEEGADMVRRLGNAMPEHGIVLTGTGRAFTAGVDTDQVSDTEKDNLLRQRLVNGVNRFAGTLYRLPCAFVCALNGHAVGAGGIMCLAADWVVAVDNDAKIGLPEAKAGLPFPAVPQIILEHGLDPVWRRRLTLTSLLYSPREAVVTGMVDEVVDAHELIDMACLRARELADQPGFLEVKAGLRQAGKREIDAILAD